MAIETALIGLSRALAAAGVPTDAVRTRSFVQAALAVGLADRQGMFWAGRACLCADPEQFALYDRVFDAWFDARMGEGFDRPTSDSAGWRLSLARQTAPAGLIQAESGDQFGIEPVEQEEQREEEAVRAQAAEREVLRHRDVAEMTPADRVALTELFAALRPRPARRPSARRRPSGRGELDTRRLLREQVRLAGEPAPARYRRRSSHDRRVVLLIDVSGSMTAYSDPLLRLAHVWVRAQPETVEVFTIGTRLTRVTDALRVRDPQQALQAAGRQVPDWSGGTRLGEVLAAFLDQWGQRSAARGAIAVIFSDGWERGTADLLGAQMARLHRIAHRVIWVNPHRDRLGYRPVQAGIVAALPHCDAVLAGHSIATFAELLEVVARS